MAEPRIEVRLRPRGHRDQLMGMEDGILLARVTAPPVGGRANKALCRMIAKRIGIELGEPPVDTGASRLGRVSPTPGVPSQHPAELGLRRTAASTSVRSCPGRLRSSG